MREKSAHAVSGALIKRLRIVIERLMYLGSLGLWRSPFLVHGDSKSTIGAN